MMKKIISLIFVMILLSTCVIATSSNELLEVMEEYYETFAKKDFESYMDIHFTLHLDEDGIDIKQSNIEKIFEGSDVLSYNIDNFQVDSNDGEVAIVIYIIKAKVGQILDGKPSVYEYEQSMTAILTTYSGWKVFQVMPTAVYDLNMNLASAIDAFPDDLLYSGDEPNKAGFFSKIGSFFKRVPQLFRKNPPSTCGNLVCDSGETVRNCAEDCKVISYNPECGNGVCSDDEDLSSCPYDCEELVVVEPVIEEIVDVPEDVVELVVEETGCIADSDCGLMQVCYKEECLDVKCKLDADCEDNNNCTEDVCEFSGNKNAYCSNNKVTRCSNKDGCCPKGCEYVDDSDCEETEDDTSDDDDDSSSSSGDDDSADTSSWTTGTETIVIDDLGDHVFFDFSAGDTTDDFDLGDIFFNSWGDLMGECINQGAICTQFNEEDLLDFDEMEDAPISNYIDSTNIIKDGDLYWITTLEGKYGKIEITNVEIVDDFYTEVSFKWGYEG